MQLEELDLLIIKAIKSFKKDEEMFDAMYEYNGSECWNRNDPDFDSHFAYTELYKIIINTAKHISLSCDYKPFMYNFLDYLYSYRCELDLSSIRDDRLHLLKKPFDDDVILLALRYAILQLPKRAYTDIETETLE